MIVRPARLPGRLILGDDVMRTTWGVAAVAVAGLVAGCGGGAVDTVPLPTDGPNQVVLSVPGMT